MTRLRLGRSISLWALFALLVPGLAGALPPLRGYPNDGRKPLDASFLEAQRGWEFGNQLGQKFGACGSGQCIGGSFCDSCRCYSPTTDISRAFCQCRLADPSCGLGECVGPNYCTGPYCTNSLCYIDTAPISQVMCQGFHLDDRCNLHRDCGPGYCVGDSFCDDCLCYAPSAPISQLACRCHRLDPSCGFGECLPNGAYCEAGHCPAPVCYAPDYFISLVMCQGGSLDCNCELQCATPPPGMRAWWPYDEPVGPGASDIVGGNNGVHQGGPTPQPGKVAGGLFFDGVDDRVVAPLFGGHNYMNLTVDAWIRPEALSAAGMTVIEYGSFVYALILEGSELRLVIQPFPVSFAPISSGANIAPGTWTHVAVTASTATGEIRFYVDGNLVTVFTGYSASGFVGGSGWVTGMGSFGNRLFHGTIDEVEIFERALTADEIRSIYAAGSAGKCK